MHLSRLDDLEPFTTLDGSTIRELAGPSRRTTPPTSRSPRRPCRPAARTTAHFHRTTEEIYLFTAGHGPHARSATRSATCAPGDARRHPARHACTSSSTTGDEPLVLLCCCAPAYSPRGHRPRRSRRTCSRRLLACAARRPPRCARRPPARAQARRSPSIGIGEQKPEMFSNPHFTALGCAHVRVITAWDALRHRWQRARARRAGWPPRARRGVAPLLGFGHSRARTARARCRRPSACAASSAGSATRYPWVTDFADLERGQPLRRADLPPAARSSPRYYNTITHDCHGCTVLAADVLDTPNMPALGARSSAATRRTSRASGACTTTSTPTASARRGTRALLRAATGESGSPRPAGSSSARNRARQIALPGRRARGEGDALAVRRLVPLSPRLRRVYFYHWNATDAARHVGLRAHRPARQAAPRAATCCRERRTASPSAARRAARDAARGHLRHAPAARQPPAARTPASSGCAPPTLILHAGDVSAAAVLAELEALGPPVARGARQRRRAGGRARLPDRAGRRVRRRAHRDGPRRRPGRAGAWPGCARRFPDADAVVFGHSHIPLHERGAGRLSDLQPRQPDRPPPPAAPHDGRRGGRRRRRARSSCRRWTRAAGPWPARR